ncbi:MAG: hypothetical protein FWC60_03580 [Firmicutes bacterium]|nr:hypothetical protein [Bacillota bacterium]
MVKKTCPNCNRDSFSTMLPAQWYCPYCNADISQAAAKALLLSSISLRDLSRRREADRNVKAEEMQA